MTATEPLTDLKSFEWLVESRCKIQELLLKLYIFSRSRSENINSNKTLRFQLLAGVCFSLWRAVFLAENDLRWPEIDSDSTHFLAILIRDNAINYAQDYKTRAWSCGYYLNNAYFRLAYYDKELAALSEEHSKCVHSFLTKQSAQHDAEPSPRSAWDRAYEIANDAFSVLNA